MTPFLPLHLQQQPYTEEVFDTRNIACVLISVVVEDVQDEPPIFIHAPPVTRVPATAVQGDKVASIEAKDGDRGTPRSIRYSILPSSSLYTKYFRMDPRTGIITMNETAAKLRENMMSLDPILMTVTADEVTNSPQSYPALSSSVEIAFVVLDAELLIPKFVHETYVGLKGNFALELEGDKGAFSVQPGVVSDAGDIQIKVKNSFLLDYEENTQISFKLIARQVTGRQHASNSADVTIRIIDVNDNPPQFSQPQYEVSIFENMTRGTSILRVYAEDDDDGEFGIIRYTSITGVNADKLSLDPKTGVIRCETDYHGFDRETAAEYILTVEAKDNDGKGSAANTATAKIIIRLKDINDSPPRFVDSIYKGVMNPDGKQLRDPVYVRAVDDDAERPNNEVVYSLEDTSYSRYFYINRNTGMLDVNQNFKSLATGGLNSAPKTKVISRGERAFEGEDDTVITLIVKATDLGSPPLTTTVPIKIYKQEFGERVIRFIYPKDPYNVDKRDLAKTLNSLTGGTTEILSVLPLNTGYLGKDVDHSKSDITALVKYNYNTVIDVTDILSRMNDTELQKLKSEKQQVDEKVVTLESKNSSFVIGVVFLVIIVLLLLLSICLCFFCEGCPLHRSSKAFGDDGPEGVSYVRVEDPQRYMRENDDVTGTPDWWQCMPDPLRRLFLCCGYIPPSKKGTRVAWSGDERERQRYGRVVQGPDAVGLEDRGGMVQALQRHQMPHQSLTLEDIDGKQGHMMGQMGHMGQMGQMGQMGHMGQMGQMGQMGPANQMGPAGANMAMGINQEPRRVFVLKDAMGIPRNGESLQEGNTYLLEDIDDQKNAGYHQVQQQQTEHSFQQPGNAERLRQHVSPRDAAILTENQRRARRADMGPEGSVFYNDGGRQGNQRYVDGQYGPHNQGYIQEYQGRGGRDYDRRNEGDNYQRNAERQGRNQGGRGRDDIDGGNDGYDSERMGKHRSRSHPPENQTDRSTDPLDRNTKSARSSSIPGTHGYQHTKTSILRYESNKQKIEEEREELLKKGIDPDDPCISHQGAESRKGSVRDKESRSISKLEQRRSQSQFSMPDRSTSVRRGSLPEVETQLEREAARRQLIRRNSGDIIDGDVKTYDQNATSRVNIDYDNEGERTEEIERRIQQRRSEASEALSEELHKSDGSQANVSPTKTEVKEPTTINIAPAAPEDQRDSTVEQQQSEAPVNVNNILGSGITKETIEKAIADALVNMAISNNASPNNLNISSKPASPPKTEVLTDSNINEDELKSDVENNINSIETDSKTIKDKTVVDSSNFSNENIVDQDIRTEELKIADDEIRLGVNKSSTIFEKNMRNDASVLNIPKGKRKPRNKMLEKKSIFTIAYDGMKTDQLRPESANGDP
ncbi:Cadherin-86C [Armadillidium vulgare]|nr:Cadherin-86C [Armadillidium vulgare]